MKRRSFQITLFVAFMIFSNNVKAQWHKWHFGGGVGSLTYHGDLSDKFVNAQLQELGYHAFVERMIGKKSGIYWRLESVNGHLLGSDRAPGGWLNGTSPHFDRSLNFRTRIHDANTSLVFYFAHGKKRTTPPFLNAYLKAGIGVGFFDVKGDLLDAEGQRYHYWSDRTIRNIDELAPNASEALIIKRDYDFETDLLAYEVETAYKRFKWQIPVALGLKMRLGNAVSLMLEAQYTYAMTDYLDNVGDQKINTNSNDPNYLMVADPAGYIGEQARNMDKPTGVNDGYLYVSAGLSFNVGKKTTPKTKTPIFYPRAQSYAVQKDTATAVVKEDTITFGVQPLDSLIFTQIEDVKLTSSKEDKDSMFLVEKSKDSYVSKSEDSIFVDLFQTNHKLWLKEDSLTAGKRLDSVIIVPLENYEKKYIVQYYENVLDSQQNHTAKVFKTDTLILNTESNTLKRDTAEYISGQTFYRIQPTLPDTNIINSKVSVDPTGNSIELYRNQLAELDSIYRNDTIELSRNIEAAKVAVVDTLTPSPANYYLSVPQYEDTTVFSSFVQQRMDLDSNYIKVQNDLKSKINQLEGRYQLSIDSITKVQDTTLMPLTDSLEYYKKRIEELNKKVSSPLNDTVPARLITADTQQSTLLLKTDTTVYKVDASMNSRIEELKAKIRSLESDGIQSEPSTNDTIISTPTSVKGTAKVNTTVTDTSLNGRLAQLEQQILLQKIKADSLQSLADTKVQQPIEQWSDSQVITVQNDLQNRIDELEAQLQEVKSSEPKNTRRNKKSDVEILAQQRRVDSLSQALTFYQNSSDLLRRDGYIPNYTTYYPYQSDPSSYGFQPVIEPVISIPVGGGSRKERRQQRKAEAALSEDVRSSESSSKKLVVGFDHNGKPGFIESRRMQNEGIVEEDTLNTFDVKEDSVIVDSRVNVTSEENVPTSTIIKSSVVESTVSSTDTVNQKLIEENNWLKAQMGEIQNTQDSLLTLLQELIAQSNKPVTTAAPVIIEKEVRTEIDRSQLLEGILNQPATKVFFAVGKSAVTSQYKPSLDQLAQQLNKYPELKLELKGFADPTGNAAANLQLSEKRAQSVKNYLIQTHRISADRVTVLPVGQEDNSSDMSYSRRVEVKLIK